MVSQYSMVSVVRLVSSMPNLTLDRYSDGRNAQGQDADAQKG